jgi:hypothetical protein
MTKGEVNLAATDQRDVRERSKGHGPLTRSVREWRSRWDTWILVAFSLVCLVLLLSFALPLAPLGDEYDIVHPATAYISGHVHAHVKYPSFSFYFYGLLFKLFGTLPSHEQSLRLARIVNYFIFLGNVFLLHSFLKRHFRRLWALVGAILFATLPGVMFSAMYVKTEGLLLLQLLFVLRVLCTLSDHPESLRWHVLAAIGAALSVSTKLSPLPFLLYLANAIYIRFHGARITSRALLAFGGIFLVSVLATWRNLWIFDDVLAYWKKDAYFLPGAGPWNAVTEGLLAGFPYGRYSSFLTVTMPMGLGLVGLFFLCSLLVRSIPRPIFWVLGGANLLSLVVALNVTRLRLPHGFTPYMTFFLVGGLSFLAWLGSRKPADSRILNHRLAWILVAASLAQTGWQLLECPASLAGIANARKTIQFAKPSDISGLFAYLYPADLARATARHLSGKIRDPDSLREFLSLANPKQLYVYSSYIDNMCKYTKNPTYRDNCEFFYNELLPGKAAYRLEREDLVPWRGFFLIDPELRRMRFLLFSRSDG